MTYNIEVHLAYKLNQPCDLLLQIAAAQMDDQHVSNAALTLTPHLSRSEKFAEEEIGTRLWFSAEEKFVCDYSASVEISRNPCDIASLETTSGSQLSSDVIKYLMPSRYCYPEDFSGVISDLFCNLSGGVAIQKMRDWIHENFAYDGSVSDYKTTATETLNMRKGVCRDYAHVLISMARAIGVPARIVSAYSSEVVPPDFHAVVEVFLEGTWHLVDPTGMAKAQDIIRIGVGRDAADISFLTSFGQVEMVRQSVLVSRT